MRLLPTLVLLSAVSAFAADDPLAVDPAKDLPRFPAVEPQDAAATFKVRPGFHVELVASEPLVTSPIAVSFDENGRMFVLEMRDYSEDRDVTPHLGRVRMLEDTDGDGRYDKATIFADDLAWPTGLIWANGGLFVLAQPDLIRFEDRDGDGRAEKREVIFTGFQSEATFLNVQGLPNCLQWGPDNVIHLQGSTGGAGRIRRADEKDAPAVHGDFVFDPKTYAWEMETGGGQYGMSYDNYGCRFVCNNSDHLRLFVYDSRMTKGLANLPSPLASIAADGPAAEVFRISPDEPWRVIRTRWRVSGKVKGAVEGGGRVSGYFTGATGTTVYRGDAFPSEYVGDTFTGDAGGGLIHHKRLRPDGCSLIGERPADEKNIEFAASRDTWCRPVNFANAPDGSLYIIDMYREVIEHPKSIPEEIKKYIDLTSGRDRGRIWRLAPDGFSPKPPPQLGKLDAAGLVAKLDDANGWTRDTATRLLCERREPAALPLLVKAFTTATPLGRLHALRILSTLDETGSRLATALADTDAHVREQAIHAALLTPLGKWPVDFVKALSALAEHDAEPRVQLAVVFALARLPAGDGAAGLAAIARRAASDSWIRSALLATPKPGALFRALVREESFREKPEAAALLAGLARAIGVQNDGEGLEAVYGQAVTGKANYRLLADLAEGLALNHRTLAAAAGAFTAAVESTIGGARYDVTNADLPLETRTAAARLLAFDATGEAALLNAVSPKQPAALRSAALASLGHFADSTKIAPALLGGWKELDAAGRVELSRFLASRKATALALLQAVQKGVIPAGEIGAAEARLLQTNKDKSVAALATKLLPTVSTASRDEVIKQYQPALALNGDQAKGHETYTQRCSICHRLRGEGNAFGPDLESVIAGGKEKLLTHFIDPNREVAPQFAAYTVELKNGTALAGIVAAETPAQVTLREPLGKETVLPRESIARLQTTGRSPMPEGLEAGLSAQQVADLLAFLVGA